MLFVHLSAVFLHSTTQARRFLMPRESKQTLKLIFDL